MFHRIAADLIVFIHFTWILFMIYGFIRTAYTAVIYFRPSQTEKAKKFFNRWIFRTVHVCGILFVASLAVLRKFCPLTVIENILKYRHDPSLTYPGSFMIHYIERFVYPNVNPILLITATVIVAAFTLLIFVIHPPAKIKRLFTR